MNLSRVRPQLFLSLFLVGISFFLCAGAKKPKVLFLVHPEAQESDGESFILPVQLLSGKKTFMSRMPLLTQREVKWIYPFPANDGTMGCAFYLDMHGRNLLDAYTVEERGTYVMAFLNGRHVTDLFVDKRITDGIFVIPSGMGNSEIALLESEFKIKVAN